MSKLPLHIILVSLVFFGFVGEAGAQKTTVYIHADAHYKTAIELFQKEKYGAAHNHFKKIIESKATTSALLVEDAEYYSAICATELFNKDGEFYLKDFIRKYPQSNKVKSACFYLGKYNYRKKKYTDVLDWFSQVDIYDLTTDELAEFYFKRGYSYLSTEQYSEAAKDFYDIKDVPNKYQTPAKYYYAHISYIKQNYEIALKDFISLKKDETFGSVASHYIVQLYHLQKKYDSVIAYAPKVLDTVKSRRAPEIARMIGEAYYNKSNYKEAIPYFKKYEHVFKNLSRDGNYQLGYSYYKIQNYRDALVYFIKTTAGEEEDSLSQNITYHMGDCYLKLGQNQKAMRAFKKATMVDFDSTIVEDALYNYAKLNYELSKSPYSEAIKVLKRYIKMYSSTDRADEAYTYLVNAFITTGNYREALEAIENIQYLTPELKGIYQKAAYFQGVAEFNQDNMKESIALFDKSLKYIFDKNIKADAIYWKAEAYYRLKDYSQSALVYKEYILQPGAVGKPQYGEANYHVGYAYYQQKDYENSNLWFRKYITFKPLADSQKVNDAYNRIGDGYFMQRAFARASEYYALSHNMKLLDADYALYQKALAEGVQKKYAQKISDLLFFIENYPTSSYIQKAKYELALTYLADEKNEQALIAFIQFIDEYPNSAYINTCLSKVGLIYYNKKEDSKALEYFDKLIMRDRKSSEANEAIVIVKSIYKNKGEVQEMEQYLKARGEVIPEAYLDSITYEVARNQFTDQNCNTALASLKKYIDKFPHGIFITEAHFFKAECEYASAKADNALESYIYVAGKNKNQYTEKSLYRASQILYQKQQYGEALAYYLLLEEHAENTKNRDYAVIHIMRCYYKLKNSEAAVAYANKVLAIEKTTNDIIYEAHFVTAKSMYDLGQHDDALAEYRVVANSTKNELGAEAHYYIALLQYNKGDYKSTEKTIYDLINSEVSSPYWVTSSLLLLADNYVAQKDNFQAKTILNTVLSDSDIPDLIKQAQAKLDKINIEEEATRNIKPVVVPEQILFDDAGEEQQKLFEVQTPVTEELKEGGQE